MDKYNHFKYCENLAENLKAITKSYRATEQTELQDLNAQITNAHGTIIIAIDGAESSFTWNDSDSLMEQPIYSIAVVKQTSTGDANTIFSSQKECMEIGKQIIARMFLDADHYKNGLHLLDRKSFLCKGFGPIGDNFYGVLLSYQLDQGINYTINPDYWKE